MKRIILITLLSLFIAAAFINCSGNKPKKDKAVTEVKKNTEGWIDGDTFQVLVVGGWNRDLYYIEGQDAQEGKKPKSMLLLKQDSKTAAQSVAMNKFREKLGTYIKSKSGTEDGTLIGQVIQTSLEGQTIAPQSIREGYTDMGDAEVLYHFTAKNLKKIVDNQIAKILADPNASATEPGM